MTAFAMSTSLQLRSLFQSVTGKKKKGKICMCMKKNPYSEIGASLFDPTFLIFPKATFPSNSVTLPLLITHCSHNHKMVSFEKDIKDHLDPPSPVMSRDTFH